MIQKSKKYLGFTLIELLVTLSVAAILAAMAAPSFSTFIKDNRLATQLNTFNRALNIARSEAIKRSAEVVVCASNDESTCSGTWTDGWIVFADTDEDQVVDSNEVIVLVSGKLANNITLNRNDDTTITFESNGYANAGEASSFIICDERGAEYGKGIAINSAGRVRLKDASEVTDCL